jgi:hypothetical protein
MYDAAQAESQASEASTAGAGDGDEVVEAEVVEDDES